jgi:hypothetical protein
MNADGTGDTLVAPAWAYSPAWSPDGTRLAFVEPEEPPFDPSDCGCYVYRIVEADLDGSQKATLGTGAGSSHSGDLGPVDNLEWSPAGDRITFTNGSADFGDRQILVLGGEGWVDGELCCYEAFGAAWSPTATKHAYMRLPQSGPNSPDLYTVDVNSHRPTQLTGLHPHSVEWSPDGTKLVLAEDAGLSTTSADGSGKTPLGTSGVDPDWQPVVGAPPPGYPRPKSTAPLRVSLVPAYKECTGPNRTHGPPLTSESCHPPVQSSPFVTLGTPDANGAPAKGAGHVRLAVLVGNPATPADEADVRLSLQISDVRCPTGMSSGPCSSTNTQGGRDYHGSLQGHFDLRLTDQYNLPAPAGKARGTVTDTDFNRFVSPFDVFPFCSMTLDKEVGSTCSLATSADALVLAAVREGKRAVWGLGQVQMFDGGTDGNARTRGDNSLFLEQGVFVP